MGNTMKKRNIAKIISGITYKYRNIISSLVIVCIICLAGCLLYNSITLLINGLPIKGNPSIMGEEQHRSAGVSVRAAFYMLGSAVLLIFGIMASLMIIAANLEEHTHFWNKLILISSSIIISFLVILTIGIGLYYVGKLLNGL